MRTHVWVLLAGLGLVGCSGTPGGMGDTGGGTAASGGGASSGGGSAAAGGGSSDDGGATGGGSTAGGGGAATGGGSASVGGGTATGGGSAATGGGSAALGGGSAAVGGGSSSSGGGTALPTACPSTGTGAIIAPAPCFVFTPVQAGANDAGVNAYDDNYALEPASPARGMLVVHINSSLSSPAGQIASPSANLYSTLAAAGFHVLAIAYRSDDVIGVSCLNKPACFAPTRQTVITGHFVTGAATTVANMRADEGIEERLDAALQYLVANRPGEGWDAFVGDESNADVSKHIAWNKVITSGHSQGGGHAAMIGQLVAVHRVVQLSSTCDQTQGTPAPWTDASATWATTPSASFVGFAAPTTFTGTTPSSGDTTCPYHFAIWQNMGMDAGNMHDDAATCGNTGDTHGDSIGCVDNASRWAALYE